MPVREKIDKCLVIIACVSITIIGVGCQRRYEGTYVKPRSGYETIERDPNEAVEITGKSEIGIASYYGHDFHGKPTANGETFDMYAFTAAHKTLPFDTKVKVTRISNGKSVIVRINDRGPFAGGRIIDLSYVAAEKLDMLDDGVAKVKIEVVK